MSQFGNFLQANRNQITNISLNSALIVGLVLTVKSVSCIDALPFDGVLIDAIFQALTAALQNRQPIVKFVE